MGRKVTYIESDRSLIKSKSYDIVYEWEDVLSEKLNISIKEYSRINELYHGRFEKNALVDLYHCIHKREDFGLHFIMRAETKKKCILNSNKIPVIIDFWLLKRDLPRFYEAYKYIPLLLVTNKEVYDLLKTQNCPFPVEHWPLSFPDKYIPQTVAPQKKYDFAILGRPNPFFIRLLDEYVSKHPGFKYVINNGNIKSREYRTNEGKFVAKDIGRESYIQMLKDTRVTCYTTPGLDESKKETTLFNQVTPRLFEMLANGCHVIGHYPPAGADVKYYNLSTVIPNVNNYADFERELNRMLSTPFDVNKAKAFLVNHCTSVRAEMLKDILGNHGIVV